MSAPTTSFTTPDGHRYVWLRSAGRCWCRSWGRVYVNDRTLQVLVRCNNHRCMRCFRMTAVNGRADSNFIDDVIDAWRKSGGAPVEFVAQFYPQEVEGE